MGRSERAMTASSKAKERYDKRLKSAVLKVGDRVLVRNLSERGGPGKLRSHWERNIHVVRRRISDDAPVYEVEAEDGSGRKRVLHRNLLFQCEYLPLDETVEAPQKQRVTRKERNSRIRITQPLDNQEDRRIDDASNSSDSDDFILRRVKSSSEKMVDYQHSSEEDLVAVLNSEAEPYVPEAIMVESSEKSSPTTSDDAAEGHDGSKTDSDTGTEIPETVVTEEQPDIGSGNAGQTMTEDRTTEEEGRGWPQRTTRPPRHLTYGNFVRPSYQPFVGQVSYPISQIYNSYWSDRVVVPPYLPNPYIRSEYPM